MSRSIGSYIEWVEQLKVRIDELKSERDGLKAELKKWEENSWTDSKAVDDRDLWKQKCERSEQKAEKLAEALAVCERLDRTPIYEYGQADRQGNKPGVGQRWMTPKEKAKEALKDFSSGDSAELEKER